MSNTQTECALVTGATSGIGAAIALKLAARGAFVGVLGRNVGAANSIVDAITKGGGRAIALIADVADPQAVETAVDHFVAQTGRLDTVVANAGIAFTGTVLDTSPQAWRQLMAINLDGAFYTAKFTMPYLIRQGGAFVAMSSDAGVQGASAYAAYCAAKHGLIGLVRCLALDHGRAGVRSNVVCPGFVETPMADRLLEGTSEAEQDFYRDAVPLGRFARPEEIANVVAHLTSEEAAYANGMTYSFDGGSTAGYYVPPE